MEVLSIEQIDELIKSATINRTQEQKAKMEISPEEQEKREKSRNLFRNISNILENVNLKRGFKKCLPFNKNISFELVHLEEMRLAEVINAMPDEAMLVSFKVEPLIGRCIIDFPIKLYKESIRQNYIDCEIIDINLSVMNILENVLNELLKIFELIDNKTNFTISNIEIKNSRTNMFPLDEVVAMAIFDIGEMTDEGDMGILSLIIPMCMLNNYMEILTSEEPLLMSNWFYK